MSSCFLDPYSQLFLDQFDERKKISYARYSSKEVLKYFKLFHSANQSAKIFQFFLWQAIEATKIENI